MEDQCNKRKVRSNRDKAKLVSHFARAKKIREEEERRREQVKEKEEEEEERYGWL